MQCETSSVVKKSVPFGKTGPCTFPEYSDFQHTYIRYEYHLSLILICFCASEMDPSAGVHETLTKRWHGFDWESCDNKAALIFALLLATPFTLLGVSVLGLAVIFLPLAICIRWLETPLHRLHPFYAIVLCVLNVASLLDVGSDIIVSAEGCH